MYTKQWSAGLSNLIVSLKQLDADKVESYLKDPQFLNSMRIPLDEIQVIMKSFSGTVQLRKKNDCASVVIWL